MSLAELIPLVLKASILAIVFSLGLSSRPGDLISLFRRPGQLARSLLAMAVVMPLVAVVLVKAMSLPLPVAVMLVALALAPVPPVLPRKQAKAGGDAAYSIGLLVAAALVSIIWIPVALELVERVFALPLGIPPAKVALLVATTILAPLIAGVVVGRLAPGLAARFGPLIAQIGGLLLLAAALAILLSHWRGMADLVGNGTLLAIAIFLAAGLAAGHLLGGPDPDHRTVLALATASRHPGVALAIAHLNFPQERALLGAVMLFLVMNTIATLPYVAWRKRVGAAANVTLTSSPGAGDGA